MLGIVLNYDRIANETYDDLPSLDRFNSGLGYIPGNVFVISYRANTLKNNGTLDEFKKIIRYMRFRPVYSKANVFTKKQNHALDRVKYRSAAEATKHKQDATVDVLRLAKKEMTTKQIVIALRKRGIDIDITVSTSGLTCLLNKDRRIKSTKNTSVGNQYLWSLV